MSGAPTTPRSTTIHVIPAEARPYQGRRAGIVTRSVVAGIDAGVALLLTVAIYAVWAGFLFLRRGAAFRFPTVGLATAIAAFVHIFVVYLTVGWATTGRTYGAQVLGLRVVDRRGRRLAPGWALLRALLCAYFPLGLVWCAVSRENRSVQDVVLRTSVIYDWEVGPHDRAQRAGVDVSPATEQTPLGASIPSAGEGPSERGLDGDLGTG